MHTVGIPVHRLGGSTLQWTLRELALTLRKRSGWEHTLAAKTHGTTMPSSVTDLKADNAGSSWGMLMYAGMLVC